MNYENQYREETKQFGKADLSFIQKRDFQAPAKWELQVREYCLFLHIS